MPPLESMDRHEKAVLWARVGTSPTGGAVVSATPVELDVRFDDAQTEMLDAHGNNVGLDGAIVTDRIIPNGSILWKGSLDDITGTGSASYPTSGLLEVKMTTSIKDIKGRNVYYTAGFLKYNDIIPTSWNA